MRRLSLTVFALTLALPGLAAAATYKETFGHDPDGPDELKTILQSLDFKTGVMPLEGAHASLSDTGSYYFLNQADAAKVLVKLWGNPPDNADGVLAMIFPKGQPPESDAWGGIVSFSKDGYVSDVDAESTDYDSLLADIKQQTDEENPARIKAGYEPIKLVGWAAAPHYDQPTHALHWARELMFGTDASSPHTLNYQLRVLGRDGVLNVNFVAGMQQLNDVKTAIPGVISLLKYDADSRYEAHKDGDRVAAYGLAGLIATAAGAKVAAKLGFLAMAALFLKKGFVVVLVAIAALWQRVKGFFRRKPAVAASEAQPQQPQANDDA